MRVLVVLAVLSAFGGWYLSRNGFLENWLRPSSGPSIIQVKAEAEKLPFGLSLAIYSFIAAAVGCALGIAVYFRGLPSKEGWQESKWNPFRRLARDQFGYDNAMMTASVQGGNDIGRLFWRVFDAGIVDGIVNGAAGLAGWFGKLFHRMQTGYVRLYALVMLMGGVGVLAWFAYAAFLAGGGH